MLGNNILAESRKLKDNQKMVAMRKHRRAAVRDDLYRRNGRDAASAIRHDEGYCGA